MSTSTSSAIGSLALIVIALALGGCQPDEPPPPPAMSEVWAPGHALATPREPNARGFLERRGQIHAHSVYSHDACDGEPVKDGERDPVCFADFRRGVCATRQDFIMLTDHRDAFDQTPFPEALLYREEAGDLLVDHGTGPVANLAACSSFVAEDGADPGAGAEHTTLLLAGAETDEMMPVGVEGHPVDEEARGDLYGSRTPENVATLRDHGAVILVAHPESKSVDELASPEVDGFEMFNLHRLFFQQLVPALDLALRFSEGDPSLPHPDLVTIRLFELDPLYLERWSQVVARGVRRTMTFGTDCHQNTLPGDGGDGERIDSYRRMMSWMANHLLVRPEEGEAVEGANDPTVVDDRALKAALRAGRLFGVFELLGPPTGFDFHAVTSAGGAPAGETIVEMGGEVALDDAPTLRVQVPDVQGLAPEAEPPEVRARLVVARADGTWAEVASHEGAGSTFTHDVTEAGVYRVEVWSVPHHLGPWLNGDAYFVLREEHAWVLSNPIYVR